MAIGVNVSNGRAQRWQTGMQCGAACKMDKLNKPPSRMETHQEAGGQRRQSKNYVRAARGVDRLMLELRSRGHAWQATGGGGPPGNNAKRNGQRKVGLMESIEASGPRRVEPHHHNVWGSGTGN